MKVSEHCRNMYTKKYHSGSPSLVGGIPLLALADALGALGVEILFCFTEGTVGMASTVLVAWLLGTTGTRAGGSCGIYGNPVVG